MNHSLSDSHPQQPQRGRRRRSRLLAVLTSGLLFLPPWPTVNAEAPDPGPLPRLLLPTNETNTSSAATAFPRRDPRSTRPLILNPAVVGSPSSWLQPGGQFRLDLLEHQDVTVAIDAVDATVTGGQIIRGRATSDEASSVTLTLEGKSLTGFVRLSGLGAFRVAPQGTGETLEVSRVEARAHALCGTLPQPVPARTGVVRHAEDLPPADALAEPTVVDVMFLYTPQTVSAEGSEEGIRRRILDSVEETNYRLTNSLINVRIHPVFIGLYNTFETGDLPRDTYRLSSGTDGMERVPQLRNDYKADLVCLLTEWENQGIGGMAWDLTPPQGNPATGFGVIRRPLMAKGFMVLAHELGHLLGCAHDREHAGFPLDSEFATARKPYMFGHRFEVEGVTYIDTMSYEPGIYVPYYGNPRLSLDGVALGKPAESERPSDGARTINETAPYVARYRTALSRIEFAESRVVAAEESGSAIIRLVRTGDLNTSTRVNLSFDPSSSAKVTLDYNWPASTLVDFGTNQATADVVIPVLTDALVEGEEFVRISLRNALGDHGIGLERTCELVILDASTPVAYSQIEFRESPLALIESASEARVRVMYSGPATDEESVIPYQTTEGTAKAGVDFQAVSGFLTNQPGTASWEISIPLLPNPAAGPDRTLNLIVGTRTNVVRILDEQRVGSLRGNPGRDLSVAGDLNSRVRGDGKLLVWGNFSQLAGQKRTGIALLNADGTVDDGFRPPEFLLGHRSLDRVPTAGIAAVAAQADGKLVLAGNFSRVGGQPRTTMVRLHSDGSVDETFGRNLRFDGAVLDVVIQPDGRILVGGPFEHINGVRRPFIARLQPDGTVDDSFQPNGGPTSDWTVNIHSIALQPDGKILMGGYFKEVDGTPMLNLARLNPDGTFDSTFKLKTGASGPVWRVRVQADGKIVVGGVFDTLGGRAAKRLARLHPDGLNDLAFRPPNPNADVNDFVCLPDGRLLVKGSFTALAGRERRFLAMLNPDGTLDAGFDLGTGPDGFLGSQLLNVSEGTPLLADGTLYLSGPFQHFNGMAAPNLVRLHLGELVPRLQGERSAEGESRGIVHGLPGGVYPMEASGDLEHWQAAGEVRLTGYDREARFTLPAPAEGNRFLRLKSPKP